MRILIAGLFFCLLCGCNGGAVPNKVTVNSLPSVFVPNQDQTLKAWDWSSVQTVGNHTYIPFNRWETSMGSATIELLKLVDEFEKIHSDVKITHWRVREINYGLAYQAYIAGVYIDHEPRQGSLQVEKL